MKKKTKKVDPAIRDMARAWNKMSEKEKAVIRIIGAIPFGVLFGIALTSDEK